MKRYIIAIVIVLVAFFAFGLYKIKQRKAEYANLPKPPMHPFTVTVVKPKKGTLEVYETYRGYYEALKKGVLAAKASGLVEKLYVKEGDSFKKGQILAVVDPTEIKSNLQAAKAKLEALKAALEAAKIAVETQKSIYERNLKLYQTGGISKEALQLSESAYKQAKAQYANVVAQIEATKAQIETLKNNLERYSKIAAPYDGVVTKLFAREGSFVGPGKPILGIEGRDRFRILVQVPKDTPVGQKASVNVGGKELLLKVSKVFPSATKDLKVVELDTPNLNVPTESFVNVKLQTQTCQGYLVPSDAILYLNKGTFVVSESSKALPVKVKALDSNLACVEGNLENVKGVIVAGQYRLREIALHHYPIRIKSVH